MRKKKNEAMEDGIRAQGVARILGTRSVTRLKHVHTISNKVPNKEVAFKVVSDTDELIVGNSARTKQRHSALLEEVIITCFEKSSK